MQVFLKKSIMILIIIAGNMLTSNFASAASTTNAIQIDGYYGDWTSLPYSWEYNHNNPYIIENYWDETQKKNITKTYLDEYGNPYNLEIRHKMAMYCDGDYVYLHIEISDKPGSGINGEDYRFYVDGEQASFRVTYSGGDGLNKNDKKIDPGIYVAEVRHRDGGMSNMVVSDATAAFTKKDNDKNNEMEIKIPLSAMKYQNRNINIDAFNMIEFYCPNLMYRRIACSGVSTAPYIGIGICFIAVAGTIFISRRYVRSKKL